MFGALTATLAKPVECPKGDRLVPTTSSGGVGVFGIQKNVDDLLYGSSCGCYVIR